MKRRAPDYLKTTHSLPLKCSTSMVTKPPSYKWPLEDIEDPYHSRTTAVLSVCLPGGCCVGGTAVGLRASWRWSTVLHSYNGSYLTEAQPWGLCLWLASCCWGSFSCLSLLTFLLYLTWCGWVLGNPHCLLSGMIASWETAHFIGQFSCRSIWRWTFIE